MYSKTIEHTKHKSDQGFTLIEMSFVILILGMMITMFAQPWNIYLKKQAEIETQEEVTSVSSAISQFRTLNGRYPCPAALDAAPGTAAYGREDCTIADFGNDFQATMPGTCTGGSCIRQSIQTVAYLNPFNGASVNQPARVRYGSVPFRNLNIPEETAIDGYGNRLVYAVTEHLAFADSFESGTGGIEVLNDQGVTVLPDSGSAHYIVISAGENELGGIARSGQLVQACPPATILENANCSLNAVPAVFSILNQSEGNNIAKYDDIAAVFTDAADPWMLSNAATHEKDTVLRNPIEKIGFNTARDVPLIEEVNIQGALRARDDVNTAGAAEGQLRSEEICDGLGQTRCFRSALIGGVPIIVAGFPDLTPAPPSTPPGGGGGGGGGPTPVGGGGLPTPCEAVIIGGEKVVICDGVVHGGGGKPAPGTPVDEGEPTMTDEEIGGPAPGDGGPKMTDEDIGGPISDKGAFIFESVQTFAFIKQINVLPKLNPTAPTAPAPAAPPVIPQAPPPPPPPAIITDDSTQSSGGSLTGDQVNIGGGLWCPPGSYISAIKDSAPICTTEIKQECPAGFFMNGTDAQGYIVCDTPPLSDCQATTAPLCGSNENLPAASPGALHTINAGNNASQEYICDNGTWVPNGSLQGQCTCTPFSGGVGTVSCMENTWPCGFQWSGTKEVQTQTVCIPGQAPQITENILTNNCVCEATSQTGSQNCPSSGSFSYNQGQVTTVDTHMCGASPPRCSGPVPTSNSCACNPQTDTRYLGCPQFYTGQYQEQNVFTCNGSAIAPVTGPSGSWSGWHQVPGQTQFDNCVCDQGGSLSPTVVSCQEANSHNSSIPAYDATYTQGSVSFQRAVDCTPAGPTATTDWNNYTDTCSQAPPQTCEWTATGGTQANATPAHSDGDLCTCGGWPSTAICNVGTNNYLCNCE